VAWTSTPSVDVSAFYFAICAPVFCLFCVAGTLLIARANPRISIPACLISMAAAIGTQHVMIGEVEGADGVNFGFIWVPIGCVISGWLAGSLGAGIGTLLMLWRRR